MTTDSDRKNPEKTDSRLAKHMQALGLEDHGFTGQELSSELKGLASMKPLPLDLDHRNPQRSSVAGKPVRASWYGAGLLAMAAMLAVMVYVQRDDDGFRVKGSGQVVVYTESNGAVETWDKKSALADGVRVRVEFKALEDLVAFVGVTDGDGNDLFAPATVWAQRLSLPAGQVAASPGSIELTGADDDETLIAVTCRAADAPADFSDFSRLWAEETKLAGRCVVEKLRLR